MEELWRGKIERLIWGGLGIARAADGKSILLSAPLALFPGEEVEARVRWKARHGEGEVLRWLQKDPNRICAACPVAERCGGCDLWEAGPCASDLKHQITEDLFQRQLRNAPPFEWIPAPPEARRHRIQLHWDGRHLGFHRRGSHEIVSVEACPAATEHISAAIQVLASALADGTLPRRPQRWELVTGTPSHGVFATSPHGKTWILEDGHWVPTQEAVVHQYNDLKLHHQAGGFFQVCAPWAMCAFDQILRSWELKGETLYDLFGGVGLFSALLGSRFPQRVLVESAPDAVRWAEKNLAHMSGATHCIEADVAGWLQNGIGSEADVLLLDPPRAGLDALLVEKLLLAQAGTLVLVGCDGAAFCRDAKALDPAWELHRLAALDLFPLTVHVECVGLFKHRSRQD